MHAALTRCLSSLTHHHHVVITVQVLHFSFCAERPGSSIWAAVNDSLEFTLAAVMFLLVAARFLRESFQMYKITRRWQPGRYTKLFAREGMLYFLAYVLTSSLSARVTHARLFRVDVGCYFSNSSMC